MKISAVNEIEELPDNPTTLDILDYFFLPEQPEYNPEPVSFDNDKPILLILKSETNNHFYFDGTPKYSKSPLANSFYNFLARNDGVFNVVFETNQIVSIKEIVEKKLNGIKPTYVLYGYTDHYGILIDPTYMKENGIKFIFTVGDIDCYEYLPLPSLIMDRVLIDYLLVNLPNMERELAFLSHIHPQLVNSLVILCPWGIDTKTYFDKGLERDIDVSFICSYGGDDEAIYHKKRENIANMIENIGDDHNLEVKVGQAYGDEYIDILNRSKIAVVEPSMRKAFVQKYLEVPFCGAMLLGEIPKGSPFVDNISIAGIKNGDYESFLREKILHYLSHQDERSSIIKKSKESVSSYTVENITKQFEDAMVSENGKKNGHA